MDDAVVGAGGWLLQGARPVASGVLAVGWGADCLHLGAWVWEGREGGGVSSMVTCMTIVRNVAYPCAAA